MPINIAQHLPACIIDRINSFVYKPLYSLKLLTTQRERHVWKIKDISMAWRYATLPFLFSFVSLYISKNNKFELKIFPVCRTNSKGCMAVSRHFKYIKKVDIFISLDSIADGSFLKMIAGLGNIRFLGANLLNLHINMKNKTKFSSTENVFQFAQHIKKIVPNYKKIKLKTDLELGIDVQIFQANYVLLLTRELAHTDLAYQQFLVDLNPNYVKNIGFNNIGVTSLWFSWGSNWQEVSSFICANASIIQDLYLLYNAFDGFESIFIDGKQMISYPNMTRLRLSRIHINIKPIWNGKIDNNVAPFPILKEFYANFDCKFMRNIVFRNNRSTLKKITIYTDYSGVNSLNTYYSMQFNKKPLEMVVLDSETSFSLSNNLDSIYETFTRFTLSTVRKLVIFSDSHYNALLACLPNAEVNSSIYQLCIMCADNPFCNILKLLTAFTGIQKLECNVSKIDDQIDSKNMQMITKQMLETQGKLNTNLTEWVIFCSGSEPSEHFAASIMLLTKACFNLKVVCMEYGDTKLLINSMRNLNSSEVLADLKTTLAPLPRYIFSRTAFRSDIRLVYNSTN